MQRELRDVSKERAAEATATRNKQLQFDRQVAEMSLSISRLQSQLRDAQRGTLGVHENGAVGDDGKRVQIQELSEQVLRHQEKLGRSTSEVSALKSRLQVAISRAEKAEEALASAESNDIESAPASGNYGEGMRRRGGRRRQAPDSYGGSIRSAIHLNDVTESSERIGKAIDAVDKFSVDAGKSSLGQCIQYE